MNIPNALTISRLILTILFVAVVSTSGSWNAVIALVAFSVASFTDFLDGYLARKMNKVTALGKLLDPLADKILTCSGFVYLTFISYQMEDVTLCPLWVTCIILGREFMVTGLRQLAVEQGVVIAADRLGKWKTIAQLVFQIGALCQIAFGSYSDETSAFLKPIVFLADADHYLIPVALYVSVALTLISGFNYFYQARVLLFLCLI